MRDALAATTAALVQRAADPTARSALDHCTARLEAAGFSVDALPDGDAVVARRGAPTLLFSGHVDVVPAGDGWPVDPHGGAVRDGAVWGRGASDMLGAVACFLELARHRPELEFAVSLTTDEETGMGGARDLVDAGLLEGVEAAIIGEPTDLQLGLAQKGVFWFRLTARGESAHASQPGEGHNAITRLVEALHRLNGVDLPWSHPLLGASTVVPSVIAGGDAINVVPSKASARVDVRFPPPATAEAVRERVGAALGDAAVELTVEAALAPFETAPEGPLATAAAEALAHAGHAVERVGLPYGTEASRFAALGLEMAILGPGVRDVIHTNRERVPLENLEVAYRAYEALAERWEAGRHG